MRIDLSSDTATRPGSAMLAAMAAAVTGDEQKGEDPVTAELIERTAELLGQESALFLPSGTMCNLISMAVLCGSGDEIIGARNAHIFASEGAGFAIICGASFCPIETPTGLFGVDDLRSAVRRPRPRSPRSRVMVIEQTCNRGGGTIWPLAGLRDVADAARSFGMAVHIDGARLLNAVVESDVAAREFGGLADAVWLDFSKGLGCPVGAVLAGSRGFIEEAWVWKHRLGGAMRQSGVMAAACLYALDDNVERLREDHGNARHLAVLLSNVEGVSPLSNAPETNIVILDLARDGLNAEDLSARLLKRGIRLSYEGAYRLRAVTHLDVSRADVEDAGTAIREIMSARGSER